MFHSWLKFQLISLSLLAVLFVALYAEGSFHVLKPVLITESLMKETYNISKNRAYELKSEYVYQVEFSRQDEERTVSLFWAKTPFEKILVLFDGGSLDPKNPGLAVGKLEICYMQCKIEGMDFYREDILSLLKKNFPKHPDENDKWPRYILNTIQKPKGWSWFLGQHKGYAIALVASILMTQALWWRNRKK